MTPIAINYEPRVWGNRSDDMPDGPRLTHFCIASGSHAIKHNPNTVKTKGLQYTRNEKHEYTFLFETKLRPA